MKKKKKANFLENKRKFGLSQAPIWERTESLIENKNNKLSQKQEDLAL